MENFELFDFNVDKDKYNKDFDRFYVFLNKYIENLNNALYHGENT